MAWYWLRDALEYAGGIDERTFRAWLRDGLRHSRLPSGRIMVSQEAIDEYLERYTVKGNFVDVIVDEVIRDLEKV